MKPCNTDFLISGLEHTSDSAEGAPAEVPAPAEAPGRASTELSQPVVPEKILKTCYK